MGYNNLQKCYCKPEAAYGDGAAGDFSGATSPFNANFWIRIKSYIFSDSETDKVLLLLLAAYDGEPAP